MCYAENAEVLKVLETANVTMNNVINAKVVVFSIQKKSQMGVVN
jgi:enamine deaminase RidA (YjgF/YER057c/UK114 family)